MNRLCEVSVSLGQEVIRARHPGLGHVVRVREVTRTNPAVHVAANVEEAEDGRGERVREEHRLHLQEAGVRQVRLFGVIGGGFVVNEGKERE